MPSRTNKDPKKDRELHQHKTDAEDERGQRPANEQEQNYRPPEQRKGQARGGETREDRSP
jgi:hypothetical protein